MKKPQGTGFWALGLHKKCTTYFVSMPFHGEAPDLGLNVTRPRGLFKREVSKKNCDNGAYVTYIFKIAKIANLKADYRHICQICSMQK